jgi:transcriptional regulator GlxA family with amidase domain
MYRSKPPDARWQISHCAGTDAPWQPGLRFACASIVPVGLLDLVRKSIDLASTLPTSRARRRIDVSLVAAGARRTVKAAGGLALRCDETLESAPDGDVVVVPAIDPDVLAHLARNRAVLPWLCRQYERASGTATSWRSARCSRG